MIINKQTDKQTSIELKSVVFTLHTEVIGGVF